VKSGTAVRVATVAGVLWGLAAVVRYVLVARAFTGGPDFFYYTMVARDLSRGWPADPLRHGYFPGAYAAYRACYALGIESVEGLATCYLLALVANALLVAAIVLRVARRGGLAAFAGFLTFDLSTRLQGLEGCVEPFATLGPLAGLLAWSGAPLRGRGGVLRALALGAGLGLGVSVKQQ
jgi:hypothetical protein